MSDSAVRPGLPGVSAPLEESHPDRLPRRLGVWSAAAYPSVLSLSRMADRPLVAADGARKIFGGANRAFVNPGLPQRPKPCS